MSLGTADCVAAPSGSILKRVNEQGQAYRLLAALRKRRTKEPESGVRFQQKTFRATFAQMAIDAGDKTTPASLSVSYVNLVREDRYVVECVVVAGAPARAPGPPATSIQRPTAGVLSVIVDSRMTDG